MVIAHAALTTASCNAITRAMKGQWLAISIQNLYVRLTYSYVNVRKMSWKKKSLLFSCWLVGLQRRNFQISRKTSFLLRSSCVKDTPAGWVNQLEASRISCFLSATPTANIPHHDLEFSSERNLRKVLSSSYLCFVLLLRFICESKRICYNVISNVCGRPFSQRGRSNLRN